MKRGWKVSHTLCIVYSIEGGKFHIHYVLCILLRVGSFTYIMYCVFYRGWKVSHTLCIVYSIEGGKFHIHYAIFFKCAPPNLKSWIRPCYVLCILLSASCNSVHVYC